MQHKKATQILWIFETRIWDVMWIPVRSLTLQVWKVQWLIKITSFHQACTKMKETT